MLLGPNEFYVLFFALKCVQKSAGYISWSLVENVSYNFVALYPTALLRCTSMQRVEAALLGSIYTMFDPYLRLTGGEEWAGTG